MRKGIPRHDRVCRQTPLVRGVGVVGAALAVLAGTSPASALVTEAAGADYIALCEANGVAIPTVVDTTGNNGWTKKSDLLPDLLRSRGNFGPAEVYYWTHSEGTVCLALPRELLGNPTSWSAIGLICQSKVTSKACFLDTNGPKPKSQEVYLVQGADPVDYVAGNDLTDRCTSCHQGQNAFLVHPGFDEGQPGDPIGFGSFPSTMIPDLVPNDYYEPIHPSWMVPNPPQSDLGCGGCHSATSLSFPDLSMNTANYCDILLWTVGDGREETAMTMPLGQRPVKEAMLDDYNALREACGQLPLPKDNPAMQSMNMDEANKWYSVAPLLPETTQFTEGSGALRVAGDGYVTVTSAPFDSWYLEDVGDQLKLDVYVPPAGQPNPYWLGSVQLYMTIPGTGQINQFLGHQELTPLGTGWKTLTFDVPNEIETSLLSQQTGVRFHVAVNTPPGAPSIILDYLRFSGNLQEGPPAPERGVTRFEFERGGAWEGVSGAVSGSVTSSDVGGYATPSALKINLTATGVEGFIYTEPVVSPEPGSTVKFRVYIPTGAPVTAVQPYVFDAIWQWSDSWYGSLPRDAWFTLSVTVPVEAVTPIREIGLKLYTSQPYSGAIYLDAVEY